jgi:hypothetical protein
MSLEWKPDPARAPDHMRADTPHGEYLIGPRRSDGAWEYATPDEYFGDHNFHICDGLAREQAFAAVDAEYAKRAKP